MAQNFEKPAVGFNHNIKHQGKIYHVQTEDSGVRNAHIITHLFVGGNIIASKKISYADIRAAENLPEVVRQLMEEQHKEMLRNLVSGVYDEPVAPVMAPPGAAAANASPPAGSPTPPAPAPTKAKGAEVSAETLFGEDLISEKSLDEVILRYLAGEKD
jgi:hypothetical protein